MFVRSVVPAESWADFLPEDDAAPPSPKPNPWDGCEPASRPLPCQEPATGPLGPGAYSMNASLTQPTVRCGCIPKGARFPSEVKAGAELQRRRQAALEALAAGSDDPQQAWHKLQSAATTRTVLWASASDSSLRSSSPASGLRTTSRVLLGKPPREQSMTSLAREAELHGPASEAMTTTAQDLWGPSQGAAKRRPPIMGHPGKLEKMTIKVRKHKKDWETLSLSGGTVMGARSMPMGRPRRMLMEQV
eukprot:TRINITY_DN36512_c0_g2_i1.p1 TRINITY_DN36512_c0_g2~~TRINITY_DN36512_c0_g2_i1.p1  ORF type:complete len:247 (-),score=46.87 TRINITY_DN36512_c0_g2_i1:77-817(-)